ncbi:MAG: chemotaxis protein CheC [Promethearchaeota archaeon]
MELDDMALSAVQEIGNIGCSSSANNLSKLIDSTIMINPPEFPVIALEDIPAVVNSSYGGGDTKLIFIYSEVLGNSEANLLFVFPYFFVTIIIDTIMGMEIDRPDADLVEELSDMDKSAIEEIGNILSGNYISSVCDFMGISLMPAPPRIFFGNINEINLPTHLKFALVIANQFKIQSVEEPVGDVFLLPDEQTIKYMLQSLGLVV